MLVHSGTLRYYALDTGMSGTHAWTFALTPLSGATVYMYVSSNGQQPNRNVPASYQWSSTRYASAQQIIIQPTVRSFSPLDFLLAFSCSSSCSSASPLYFASPRLDLHFRVMQLRYFRVCLIVEVLIFILIMI
jgi:hypothetical protein